MSAPSAAWEAARHTLGRLFARAAVRRLPDDRMLPQVFVSASNALKRSFVAPGASEKTWRVAAAVDPSSLSQIVVRVSEKDSRPVAHPVGGSHALLPPECYAMPVLHTASLEVESEPIIGPVETEGLPGTFLKLPPDPLRLWQTPLLPLPKIASVGSFHAAKPKEKALRVPRPPAVRLGPARTGEAALSRVPLTRRGLEAPGGVPMPAAFAAEHRRLAETAGLPLSDVALLGVYPSIPIIAIRRLVVEEDGRLLRLWLKPESWWGRPPPHRITLLVGRQVSSGKMLQAAG